MHRDLAPRASLCTDDHVEHREWQRRTCRGRSPLGPTSAPSVRPSAPSEQLLDAARQPGGTRRSPSLAFSSRRDAWSCSASTTRARALYITVLLRDEVVPTAPTHQPVTDVIKIGDVSTHVFAHEAPQQHVLTWEGTRSRGACGCSTATRPTGSCISSTRVDRERFQEAAIELHKLLAASTLWMCCSERARAHPRWEQGRPAARGAAGGALLRARTRRACAVSRLALGRSASTTCSIFERRGYMEGKTLAKFGISASGSATTLDYLLRDEAPTRDEELFSSVQIGRLLVVLYLADGYFSRTAPAAARLPPSRRPLRHSVTPAPPRRWDASALRRATTRARISR